MWIESHQSLRNHPKVKKAARLCHINEYEMIGRLHCLWWWALDYAPDGDLTNYSPADIESAVDWSGEEGKFYNSLIGCGFNGHGGLIDVTEDSRVIHDWHEYGGRLLEKREANKERMREKRATHVQRTTVARTGATEQNRTEQYNIAPEAQNEQTDPELEHAVKKLNVRQKAVLELEGRFSTLSGLQLPKRDTEKEKRAASLRWWNPLGDVWDLCEKDTDKAWKLIEASYRKLSSEKMTIAAPQSILQTAIALHAQNNGSRTIKLTGVVNA